MKLMVIFVINARFLGSAQDIPYGAAGYTRTIAAGLRALGHNVGLIGYRREPDHPRKSASLHWGRRLGCPYAEVTFHTETPTPTMRTTFAEAVARLGEGRGSHTPLVLYHQSSYTLPFTPDGVLCAVTHHAPFVEDVARNIGADHCVTAFGGGRAKVDALLGSQERGMDWLRDRPHVRVLEFSTLQTGCLSRQGVSAGQCSVLPPPLLSHVASPEPDAPRPLVSWMGRAAGRTLLISTAARADGFKNLDAVIEAYRVIEGRGDRAALYLACGSSQGSREVEELREHVPRHLRRHCVIGPRLPHSSMLSAFRSLAGRGVFLFTSRYETLGFTPLEAMSQGLVVAVPAPPIPIGMRDYVPAEFLYSPPTGGEGIADVVKCHVSSPQASTMASEAVRELTVPNSVAHIEEHLTPIERI
ncbi:glycosyltransferase [Streptomyces iranensis]|uniref:glycosyltransferase n=1 Tax=Streptomyces iranensis TaxID=576784 RepID=UPI0039B78660